MPSSASSALASAPAATRAAVSRALARSSTLRASSKPYFCMPARSAWPGRGWCSGFSVTPGAGDISSCHFAPTRCCGSRSRPASRACGRGGPRRGSRPRRARTACAGRGRSRGGGAPARRRSRSTVIGQAGGQPLDHDHEGRAVGLPGGQVAQHHYASVFAARAHRSAVPQPGKCDCQGRGTSRRWRRHEQHGQGPGGEERAEGSA